MCGYSWRVPFSAGTGEFKVVPSQQLGDLGPARGEPVLVEWHWYHYLPGPFFWFCLVFLLVMWAGARRWSSRGAVLFFLALLFASQFL